MKIVVAITGASGIILGQRLLEELKGHETHLVITKNAEKVAKFEECKSVKEIKKLAKFVYDENEIEAGISSSSYPVDAMVVIPCSMKTLSSIANGFSDNLVNRAAENILKLNKKLIVVPRDTPLTLAAIQNMEKLKLAGAIILPANIAYYFKPRTINDITNFTVGKVLDALSMEHKLYKRWG